MATSPPGCTFACERTIALTSTSTFGMVYEASARNVVIHGSVALHAGCPSITPLAPTVPALGVIGRPYRPISTSHVSFTPRPVLVPPWIIRPLFIRALTATSTPCQ